MPALHLRLRTWAALVSLGVAAGAAACAPSSDEPTASGVQAVTEIDKAEWLEKTAKVLRYGDGIGPGDDLPALIAMSKEDVVDRWMKDARFGDAVLAFNLYYLGRGMDQVKHASPIASGFEYEPAVFDFPQALLAAKAVAEGGNYFTIFDGDPAYVAPANPGLAPTASETIERDHVVRDMDGAIARVKADRAGACEAFVQAGFQATNRLRLLGFAPAAKLRQLWLSKHPRYPLAVDCAPESTVSADDLVTSMTTVKTAIDAIWKQVGTPRPLTAVHSLTDLPEVLVAMAGLPAIVEPLGTTFFTALPSTSTNFHRKRAAYMLKTYFCDDMTPVELPATETGDGGTSDIHASNPSCQSCHHRLDPMGALFRNIGAKGRDFTGLDRVKFDDQVTFTGEAFDHYLSQWRNADGSFRAGYWILGRDGKPQREPGWTDEDGDTLSGLWSYMRRSPVVKACLVRKLAEYVLGPKQVYDREWLAEISTDLEDGPRSAETFKGVVKSLLLSKTFSIHDPAKGVCYDTPEGASPERSPCAIAHVVNAQCAGCHSSVDGPGHLDFSQWIDVGGGTYGWPHTDGKDVQLSQTESFRRMLQRITTTDRAIRMPLLRAMPAEDFATFRDWLTTHTENPQP